MIDDLLDLTEADILVISEGQLDQITSLLKSSAYTKVHSASSFQAAMELYLASPPDLIILTPLTGLSLNELGTKLSNFSPDISIPPVLLITEHKDDTPAIDGIIKDFIKLPAPDSEILFRIHHLLSTFLSFKELNTYNQSIITAIELRSQELKESQIEIIECLGYAAEFRDSETGMHTIRVGHYSQCLALALGMSAREAEHLLYSAPMHDVGKIGIPDKILLKPGGLEASEWEVMKRHSAIGESILNRSSNKLLQQASIIALSHHEKWDGNGYPNGLKGSDIPLYGRIVAIVDVFDALTMERPYKEAWPIPKAVDLITSEAGKHFDPALVQLFVDNLDQILAIKTKYADNKSNTNEALLNEYVAL